MPPPTCVHQGVIKAETHVDCVLICKAKLSNNEGIMGIF